MSMKRKRIISILLSLAMVIGLMPGMSLTAYADDPYKNLKNTTTVSDPGTTSYELRYDPGDGGTGSMDAKTVTVGREYTFPECTFDASPGKTFDHWIMSGVDGLYNPDSTVIIADNCAINGVITVTAHWKDVAIVTKAPAATNPTYNGSAQPLVTAGVASDGVMKYALGKNATTTPTEDWDTSIPTGTEAGTYYVWYKAVGDASHADSEAKCITASIKSRPAPKPTPAQKVASEIQALPDPVTLADKDRVDKVKKDYDDLTEIQKNQIKEELKQKLEKAVDTIANLQFEADKQAAAGITVKMGKVKNLKGGKVQIPLGKPHINAAKGKAASAFTAQEAACIDGFIIQYSTDKKLKKKVKTKKIKDPTTETATIKHLTKGKTYYFRACTYTEVKNSVSGDTATVKGKWSPKKKVKITK